MHQAVEIWLSVYIDDSNPPVVPVQFHFWWTSLVDAEVIQVLQGGWPAI